MRIANSCLRVLDSRLQVLLWCLVFFYSGFAAQWTVGVYMCADNGMNDQAYVDLAEMKSVGSTEEVNIVVQVDNAARDSNPGCRRYLVKRTGLELLAELGEVDMADTATLAGFGRFLAQRYPARNYMLVLWDHGNGWQEGAGGLDWIFQDESPAFSQMGVAGGEFGAAVAAVRKALGKRIAVLGLDACLMGMIEVATEVLDCCDYMLASEGLVPWGGWPYDEVLNLLVARPTLTPEEFLPEMCAKYVAEYPDEDICLSALDMRQLQRVLIAARAAIRDSIDPAEAGFRDARAGVQTFSSDPGHAPCPTDDNIDFSDFWQLAPQSGAATLRSTLGPLAVANRGQGAYGRARGAAVWFPDNYLALKTLAGSYAKLAFADSVPWLEFLNCYFATDDVKPTQPEISGHRLGGRGDLRLYWNTATDIAPVGYNLYEAGSTVEEFSDYCEELSRWSATGWSASEQYAHSGTRSFFSGSGPNLCNQLVLMTPWEMPHGGLLSFYAYFQTEEVLDSLGRFKRDVCYVEACSGPPWDWQPLDSIYGTASGWHERRYLIPPSYQAWLRLRYVTDSSDNRLGVFVDDIKAYRFGSMRIVGTGLVDTTFYIFNLACGTYHYCVTAQDSFGNTSMASQFYPVPVTSYAEPYTRPAPFAGACELWVDFPPKDTVDVIVYTISGTLVRKFEEVSGPMIEWDGKNWAGKALADGLYLVVVQGKNFRKVGKIAKVAR